MPEAESTIIAAAPPAVVVPRDVVEPQPGDPPPPFKTWCDWARDGLAKALEGSKQASGGVTEYHIGSRGLRREGLKSQVDNVNYWNQLVKFYCGDLGLPGSVTGADTACRIIPRDV